MVFYLKLTKKLLNWGLKNLVVIASFIFIFNVNFILQLPAVLTLLKRCYAFESTIGFAFAASVCSAFPITVFKSELFATTTDVGGNTSLAKRRVGDRKVANLWSIPKLAMCCVLGKDTSRVFSHWGRPTELSTRCGGPAHEIFANRTQ